MIIANGDRDDGDEIDHMDQVDAHPDAHRATTPDEGQALEELYGPPDADGFYRGEGGS
jgi:hypothetical protein